MGATGGSTKSRKAAKPHQGGRDHEAARRFVGVLALFLFLMGVVIGSVVGFTTLTSLMAWIPIGLGLYSAFLWWCG